MGLLIIIALHLYIHFIQGYGLTSDDQPSTSTTANASLIRRFNQHSGMVLKSCDKPRTNSNKRPAVNGLSHSTSEATFSRGESCNGAGLPHSQTVPGSLRDQTEDQDIPPNKKVGNSGDSPCKTTPECRSPVGQPKCCTSLMCSLFLLSGPP